jgi:hypothetical protein
MALIGQNKFSLNNFGTSGTVQFKGKDKTTRPRTGAVGDAPRVFGGDSGLGFFQKWVAWQ